MRRLWRCGGAAGSAEARARLRARAPAPRPLSSTRTLPPPRAPRRRFARGRRGGTGTGSRSHGGAWRHTPAHGIPTPLVTPRGRAAAPRGGACAQARAAESTRPRARLEGSTKQGTLSGPSLPFHSLGQAPCVWRSLVRPTLYLFTRHSPRKKANPDRHRAACTRRARRPPLRRPPARAASAAARGAPNRPLRRGRRRRAHMRRVRARPPARPRPNLNVQGPTGGFCLSGPGPAARAGAKRPPRTRPPGRGAPRCAHHPPNPKRPLIGRLSGRPPRPRRFSPRRGPGPSRPPSTQRGCYHYTCVLPSPLAPAAPRRTPARRRPPGARGRAPRPARAARPAGPGAFAARAQLAGA